MFSNWFGVRLEGMKIRNIRKYTWFIERVLGIEYFNVYRGGRDYCSTTSRLTDTPNTVNLLLVSS